MNLVDQGTAFAQDLAGGYVSIATIAPPASGAGFFRLVIKFAALNVAHVLVIQEAQGGVSWTYTAANAQSGAVVEIEVSLASTEQAWAVSARDTSGLSTTAAWTWHLYQLDLVSLAVEVADPPVLVSLPSSPTQSTGYVVTRDPAGVATAHQTCEFRLVTPPSGAGHSYKTSKFPATSDADGLLQVALMRGTSYQGRRGTGPWELFTTGNTATYALPILLGEPDS